MLRQFFSTPFCLFSILLSREVIAPDDQVGPVDQEDTGDELWIPMDDREELLYEALGGYPGRTFRVDFGDNAFRYLYSAFQDREDSVPSLNYPWSWLVFFDREHVTDVVPDTTDVFRRTFLLTIYNAVNEGPDTIVRGRTILQEGPFKIRPRHEVHEIIIETDPEEPPAWVFVKLNRPLQTFRVVSRNIPVFKVPADMTTPRWLRYFAPTEVRNAIQYGQALIVDSIPNSFMLPDKSILIKVWSYENPRVVRHRQDPNEIVFAGPYNLEVEHHETFFRLLDHRQPSEWPWYRRYFERRGEPVRYFKEFVTIRYRIFEQSGLHMPHLGTVRIISRYEHQCMRADIRYFVDLTYPVEEFYVAQGIVETVPVNAEPESINLRLEGQGRVIAQTVHTDHLDFRFDVPKDSISKDSVSGSIMHLILCILTGSNGVEAKWS